MAAGPFALDRASDERGDHTAGRFVVVVECDRVGAFCDEHPDEVTRSHGRHGDAALDAGERWHGEVAALNFLCPRTAPVTVASRFWIPGVPMTDPTSKTPWGSEGTMSWSGC